MHSCPATTLVIRIYLSSSSSSSFCSLLPPQLFSIFIKLMPIFRSYSRFRRIPKIEVLGSCWGRIILSLQAGSSSCRPVNIIRALTVSIKPHFLNNFIAPTRHLVSPKCLGLTQREVGSTRARRRLTEYTQQCALEN